MTSMKKNVSIKGKQIGLDAEMMYMRLLAINSKKKVPHERVMSYENSSVPLSIFKTDGTMNGSESKSDFLHKLEGLLPGPKQSSLRGNFDAIIIDGNALIKILPAPTNSAQLESTKYEDMARKFFSHINILRGNAKQVHITFDKYLENSPKDATRDK